MGLIDNYLLGLKQLGVNSKLARAARAALGAGMNAIPGLDGAEHLGRLTDIFLDQVINIQEIIWRTPKRLQKVVSYAEEAASKPRLSLVKDPTVVKSQEVINKTMVGAERVELPRVASSLPFKLHDVATGNAVTRRLPKLNTKPSSPIRSRANRYRG